MKEYLVYSVASSCSLLGGEEGIGGAQLGSSVGDEGGSNGGSSSSSWNRCAQQLVVRQLDTSERLTLLLKLILKLHQLMFV
jgi:hypothetical protein